MSYTKYILNKTGLFPKWNPRVEDIFDVARNYDVTTVKGLGYYYVIPTNYDFRYICKMLHTFRSNGIILRPHRSRYYNALVFRVPNRNQQFMHDVIRVSQDWNNFEQILAERNIQMSNSTKSK